VSSGKNGTVARKRIDPKLMLASLGIAVGLMFIIVGIRTSITGDELQGLPDQIESVNPVRGATQVLQQTAVFVDLAEGYTGVLVIDGVELETVSLDAIGIQPVGSTSDPGGQVSLPAATIYEPGNATLTFEPSDAALITGFSTGRHEATVVFWKIDESRAQSSSFRWDFYVV
jgi:hypothetical protein